MRYAWAIGLLVPVLTNCTAAPAIVTPPRAPATAAPSVNAINMPGPKEELTRACFEWLCGCPVHYVVTPTRFV